MDLQDLGSTMAEQMDAIEGTSYPDGTTIAACMTAVLVRLPDGGSFVRARLSAPSEQRLLFSSTLIKGIIMEAFEQEWI